MHICVSRFPRSAVIWPVFITSRQQAYVEPSGRAVWAQASSALWYRVFEPARAEIFPSSPRTLFMLDSCVVGMTQSFYLDAPLPAVAQPK